MISKFEKEKLLEISDINKRIKNKGTYSEKLPWALIFLSNLKLVIFLFILNINLSTGLPLM